MLIRRYNERGPTGRETLATKPDQKRLMLVTRNEEFWIDILRQAGKDGDPPPTLHRIQQLRAIFRRSQVGGITDDR